MKICATILFILNVGCGSTVNNYFGSDGGTEVFDNPCGDSRWYGKHLWEISSCGWGWYMAEDCSIKVAEGSSGYQDKSAKWDSPAHYNGINLEIVAEGVSYPGKLDPDFRFTVAGGRKWHETNNALDRYHGGVRVLIGVKADNIDDNVFVPVEHPYPGETSCELSEYYVGP